MTNRFLILNITAALLMGCGNESTRQDKESIEQELNANASASTIQVSETFNNVLESMPSPIESAFLLKKNGGIFDAALINPEANLGNYTSQTAMALNLGVYGTDLGYANIYGQNQQALDMMNAVKQLADGLNIGDYFDIVTLRRLLSNNNNLDSLLLISTANLQRINRDLMAKNRSHVSLLILTGGWVEGMYLLSSAYKSSKNAAIAGKIAEQKIIVNLLTPLYEQLKSQNDFANVAAGFQKIADAYAAVQMDASATSNVTVEQVNGVAVATGSSNSQATYTDADILKVAETIQSFRNEIIHMSK